MKYCQHCGKEIMDKAVICTHCGCQVDLLKTATHTSITPSVPDKVSIGLCILSLFVPLFGVIYWPVKHRSTPNRAMACGVFGIVGFLISAIFLRSNPSLFANLLSTII